MARRWSGRSWWSRAYLWATHQLYSEFAWAYDLVSWAASLGWWSRWRREALEHIIGSRVLEIGFGTGELLVEMATRGLQVWGLEPSRAMHRVTSRKLGKRHLWVPRVRAGAQALPFADGSFDSIVATFPAEYILDPATFRESARILRAADPSTGEAGRFIIGGLFFRIGRARGHPVADLAVVGAACSPIARVQALCSPWFQIELVHLASRCRWWEVATPLLVLERRCDI